MGFKEIGIKIQQAREEKGMSQEHLARLMGCSQSALSNYEKGKRRLYLPQLEQLAEVLSKPIDYFMESKPSESVPPTGSADDTEIVRLLNEIYGLNLEERQRVSDYIKFINWQRYREGSGDDQPRIVARTKKTGSKNPRTGSRRD
ncbi:MAG: helix-turn-helix domain-containing protein [Ignavibacteriales bacterium]